MYVYPWFSEERKGVIYTIDSANCCRNNALFFNQAQVLKFFFISPFERAPYPLNRHICLHSMCLFSFSFSSSPLPLLSLRSAPSVWLSPFGFSCLSPFLFSSCGVASFRNWSKSSDEIGKFYPDPYGVGISSSSRSTVRVDCAKAVVCESSGIEEDQNQTFSSQPQPFSSSRFS